MAKYSNVARMAMRFLRTPKGKQVGGQALNRAADVAQRVGGEKHAAKIEQARIAAEKGLRGL